MSNLEQYVEYHGNLLLKNCIDSHSTGLKAQFRLRDEDDLEVFKKITKRRKGHAGQIYRMKFRPVGDITWSSTEIFFLGATWSHNNGAIVAFEMSERYMWEFFRNWPALSQGKTVEAKELEVVLFKVGDDGELVNLAQRDAVEGIEKLKGGPQSIRCARLLHDPEFVRYLAFVINHDQNLPCSSEFMGTWIKNEVGIKSRKELDHNAAALERFENLIMSPFNKWRYENE